MSESTQFSQHLLMRSDVVQVEHEGVAVSMDVRLGRSFDFLDAPIKENRDYLKDLKVDPDTTQAGYCLVFSADDHYGEATGAFADKTIHVFMGSILHQAESLQAKRQEEGEPRLSSLEANLFVQEEASATIAHEWSHLADELTMGVKAIKRESLKYDLARIVPRLVPSGLLTGAGLTIPAFLAYAGLSNHQQETGALVVSIALGALFLKMGSEKMREQYKKLQARQDIYENRPLEVRARLNELRHVDAVEAGAPFIIQSRLSRKYLDKLANMSFEAMTAD
jgi:hypothetical protein